jgi:magnesium-transporting ATPase (P-type)
VPAAEVPVGARVLVAPGQRVPADGVVAAGASAADESMLTGEAAPVDKGAGDAVLGGTLNVGDAALEVGMCCGCEELQGSWVEWDPELLHVAVLQAEGPRDEGARHGTMHAAWLRRPVGESSAGYEHVPRNIRQLGLMPARLGMFRLPQVETTATAEGSTVARLGRSVEAAAAQRSPLEGAVARFAKYYTPVVLVAALLIAFVPWATNSSKSHKVLLLTCHAALHCLTADHTVLL